MASSVLQNVIHPHPKGADAARADGFEAAESALRGEEELESVLAALVENAPVAMALFDAEMRYVLANRAWIEEFSLQEVRPLLGRSQYEVFPGMHPEWRQVYARALSGHVVRSEHDELGEFDGKRLVYRWEVRPWRRNRDASVGGLMVTCEKFTALSPETEDGTEAAAENPGTSVSASASPAAGGSAEMPASLVPLVLVDENCVIHQANSAAVELCLARGLQEGVSLFAEMFSSGREMAAFQNVWQTAMDKLEAGAASAVLPVPAGQERMSGECELPERWLLSPSGRVGEKALLLAVGLPRLPPEPGAAVRVAKPTGPDLPAIASAVAALRQPFTGTPSKPAPVPESAGASGAELRQLQDDLARARQEMRTLREAEHLFSQKEGRLRHYLNMLPCGVLVLDELGAPVFQNEPLARLLGRAVKKEESVEHWLAAACADPAQREEAASVWREDVWRRQLTRVFSLATADGLLKELEFQPRSLPGGGLLVCIQDATERCRHEEQLRATEAKLRALFQEVPLAVVLADRSGAVFEVNHHAETLLGRSKSELRRLPPDAWLDAPSLSRRREMLQRLHQEAGRTVSLEATVLRDGAPPLPCLLTLAHVQDAEGSPHNTLHFIQPLGHVAAQSAPLAGASPATTNPATPGSAMQVPSGKEVFLLATNVNGRVKTCSPRGLTLLGLEPGQEKGRALHLHFRPSDGTAFYDELVSRAGSLREMVCLGADGERRTCRLLARKSGGGGFDVELFEVAEGAEAREAQSFPTAMPLPVPSRAPWPVADLSREKLLLSETHHRIKNHLQIISSLLNLESNSIHDATARGALRSSQNRVRAIAELHQHLYQLALGTGESFGSFTEGLIRRLRECFDVPEGRVEVELCVEDGAIQQEWLMPLALVLNETVSNCFEHAFPNGESGKVQVMLTFGAEGGELCVRDNGIGLKHGGTDSAHGLGLKILSVFADQMHGQLIVGEGEAGGTQILLRFSIASTDI